MKSRLLFPGLLTAAVFATALIVTSQTDSPSTDSHLAEKSPVLPSGDLPQKPARFLIANQVAPREGTFTTQANGADRGFVLSLNEGMERLPEGKDRLVILDPPATPATLAQRLKETGAANMVWPVCYEEGKPLTAGNRRIVTDELTIRVAENQPDPELPDGLEISARPDYAPGFLVVSAEDPFQAIASLAELQETAGIEMVELQLAAQRQKRALPNDTLIGDQWHLKASSPAVTGSDVNIENAWLYGGSGGVRGSGVRIGIVDDGLQTAHPDLAANVDTANDKDWNGNDNSPEPGTDDDHGTSCAGNAGAVGNNSLGVCGTAPQSTLVGMRLIAAAASDSQESQAMAYLPDLIQIKSNSWGPDDDGATLEGPGTLTRAALATATQSGRNGLGNIILWAGGNGGEVDDNSNYDGYANSIHTIAIGATDSSGNRAEYSEPGANLVVCAPSSGAASTLGITTTDRTGSAGYANGDYTNDFGGTSSATPTAAGIVALILEENPALGWRDVQEILIRSAAKIDPSDSDWIDNGAGFHFNHNYGAGLIDATAAVNMAAAWSNLAAASSDTVSQTGLSVSIPDNSSAGITRTLNLTGANLRCEQVTLTASITHPYRGDLSVTLISPSGTESRLAEAHNDGGSNYSSWTFSTVRHWGENSAGAWTVRIADEASGDTGTLTALTLTAHGASGTPTNPGPVVAIASPIPGSSYSPGTQVAVTVTASDVTADGSAGTVASVELLDNGISQGVLTSTPYQFTLNPAVGNHSLTAIAIDGEGESSTSGAVVFSVVNQAPVITAASLSPAPQAFSDEEILVTGLTASDPEGEPLTYQYQWFRSDDGVTWSDSGIATATLAAAPSRAGFLWRCQITANDGSQPGEPFTTAATNSLTRPPATVAAGESFTYTSGLVLRGSESTLSRDAIVNEFSQGSAGSSEWVELLVLRETSLRGWSLADSNSSILVFADSPVWDAIPAGTLIVIYNGSAKDSLLPADDTGASDGTLVLAHNDASHFSGGWPSFGNGGDNVRLLDPSDALVAGFSYGSNTAVSPTLGAIGSGRSAYFTGDKEADASLATSWTITTATSARAGRGTRLPTSLPISYGGSWSALPVGFSSSGTGTYSTSLGTDTDPGSARFDSSGDTLTIEFDAAADTLAYQLKGNTGGPPATTGTFVVEESADGTTYSPLRTVIDQSTEDTAYSDSPSASARFLRFRYETKISGNLQLDQLVITGDSGTGSDGLGLSITPATFSESAGSMAAGGTVTIPAALAADLVITLTSSDVTAATVPASVSILAGQTSVNFDVSAIDDSDPDGTQFATIIAAAGGFTGAGFDLTITDDEPSLEGVTPAAGNNPANLSLVNALRGGAFNSPALFRLAEGINLPAGLTLDSATGLISGTVALSVAPGGYAITIERYNSFAEVVSQSFTLTVTNEADGYLAWIADESVSETGPHDDPDGDGLDNLLEYYLDGDAGVSDRHIAPTLALPDGTSMTLTFWHLKSATDVTGIVEWSDTLEAGSWSSTGVTFNVLTDEPSREQLQFSIPLDAAPKRFVRLRVVQSE